MVPTMNFLAMNRVYMNNVTMNDSYYELSRSMNCVIINNVTMNGSNYELSRYELCGRHRWAPCPTLHRAVGQEGKFVAHLWWSLLRLRIL